MAMYLEDMKMIRAISVNSCLQQWDLTSNSSGQEQFPGTPPNVGLLCWFIAMFREVFFFCHGYSFFFLSTKSTLILIQCGLGLFVAFPISLQLSASARRRDITLESCTRLGLLFETSFHTRCSLQVLC